MNRWAVLLKTHYTAPLSVSFQQFKLGAMLFFFGLVVLYIGNKGLAPSLMQELITLLGLMIGGSGFLIAMLAQMRMIISRLVHFFLNDKEH